MLRNLKPLLRVQLQYTITILSIYARAPSLVITLANILHTICIFPSHDRVLGRSDVDLLLEEGDLTRSLRIMDIKG
jgi:hypothetical protein